MTLHSAAAYPSQSVLHDVGKILTELPKDVQPGTKYKFYM